jgi:hypothetical protein
MLMEKVLAVHVPGTAPINANVTYVQGSHTILVPVFPQDLSMKVFAPPFLIPGGDLWEVLFTVQTEGVVFSDVTFDGGPADLPILNYGPIDSTKVVWKTTFNTSNLTKNVEMLNCHIYLNGSDPGVSQAYKGDPTIAVVKDPIDG